MEHAAGHPELYNALLSTMGEAFARCRLTYDDTGHPCDWVFLEVNRAFLGLFEMADPVGKRNSEVNPGMNERAPQFLEACARVATTGRPETIRQHFRNGKWIDVRLAGLGKDHFFALCEDVSDRKQAEEVIARTRFLLDHIADYPLWMDRSGRIVKVSESACRRLGYARDELLCMTIFDIDPTTWDASAGRPAQGFDELWETPEDGLPVVAQTLHRAKSAEVFPVEMSITFVSFGGERYQCRFCRDVTEQRRLEESLRATRLSVDRSPDLIYWVDETGRLVYANESACRLLGYSREEMETLHLWDLDPTLQPEVFEATWRTAVARGRPFSIARTLVGKDGRTHDIELSNTNVAYHGRHLGVTFGRDVTERNRVEQRLWRSQYTLDGMSDYPLWVTPDGHIAEVSESTCRHLEYSREELLGMTVFDIDPAAAARDKQEFFAERRESTKRQEGTGSYIFETTHHTKSGRQIPVEVNVSFVTIGGVDYECSFCREISERKRLQESLYLTQVSVDQAADMIHWVDETGRLVYCNQATAETLGYGLDELLGLHLWDMVEGMTPESFAERWPEGIDRTSLVHESAMKTKDGRRIPVEVTTTSVEFAGRRFGVSVARDISERKELEHSLRLTRHAVDQAGEAISWIDAGGRFIYANQYATRLSGYSLDELRQMHVWDIDSSFPPERWAEAWRRLKTEGPQTTESTNRCRDGRLIPVEVMWQYFEFEGHEYSVAYVRDISDRLAADEELRRVQYSLDHMIDYVIWTTGDGRVVEVSEATCRQLGYAREELLGMFMWEIDPDINPQKWDDHWETHGGVGSYFVEGRHRKKNGEEFPVEVAVTRVRFGGREYDCGLCRDTTERRRLEHSLRLTQYSVDRSGDMIYWIDRDGRFLYANEAACRSRGYSPQEFQGLHIWDLDRDRTGKSWAEGWENVKRWGPHTFETVEVDRDGREYPVEVTTQHIEFEGDEIAVSVHRDISERKKAEEDLEESRRMMRLVIDTVPLRISWRDRDLRYLGCNTAVALDAHLPDTAAIVGLRDEDLPWGKAAAEALEGDREIIETGVPKLRYEESMAGPGGAETSVMRTSKVPLRDRTGNIMGILSVHEDVTDRVKTLQTLREREEQLRQSQKMEAIGRLAGGIAHDFNNVLTTIIGYSDLILGAEQLEASSVKEDVAEIKAAAERAGNLTRQILAFSRRQALRPQVLLLNTVISQTERLLERTIGADVELNTALSPDLGLVEVDEHQFVQILLNLAVNARDAMPDGGSLTLSTGNVELDEAFCRAQPDAHAGRYVRLSISDTGVGMDPDTVAHVFEPFYTTKALGQGTGLGLSTVYGVVTQSGGCITVDSELGRGSTFHIYLPRFDHPAIETGDGAPEAAPGAGRPTILVVDDDATFRALTVRLLEKRGYRVVPVGDGDRAVEILKDKDNTIDLLLTDVVMPGSLQGDHVAQIATTLRPGLPVLFMSAYTRETIMQAGRVVDGADFLEKPFTAESLATCVRGLLQSRGG